MKTPLYALRVATAFALTATPLTAQAAVSGESAPKKTVYYVEPNRGDDANSGTRANQPWRSFAKLNTRELAPGDQVMIAPGVHTETLKPQARGTARKPVEIRFLPGTHEFAVEKAIRLPMFVSNACDAPEVPKPIGILMQNTRHVRLSGGGVAGAGKTTILYGGRMVEIFNDHAEDITFSGLVFDLKRPTVSEFRVMETTENSAVIQIAEGSTHAIRDGKFTWTGDLGSGWVMSQQAIPAEGRCWRQGQWDPFTPATAEDLGGGKVRLTYQNGNLGMIKGRQFQFRHVTRDSVGVHNSRSKDIVIRDCDFYALTNMGFVSQFTENITYQRVNVASPAGTIRTCPAWGDIFQFSNCKGHILIDSCRLAGMQDDAVNCHGTHLRIMQKTADHQLLARFMHPQSYGFAPYAPGDEIAVIRHATLREYAGNPRRKVTAVERKTDKDWLVTLDGPVPAFAEGDVLDNLTWQPDLIARNNHVSLDPVRGFLLTTRGRVLIENNTFHRCAMPGILVEDDAEGWFESSAVRDLTIRNNRFIGCGVEINPQTRSVKPEEPVHENIRIENNFFDGAGVSAKSVRGLTVTGNRTPGGSLPVSVAPSCSEVTVKNNATKSNE